MDDAMYYVVGTSKVDTWVVSTKLVTLESATKTANRLNEKWTAARFVNLWGRCRSLL